ncbi:MAG: hypothetical protein SCK70_06755 [bacterium]|nr:hypothetical protein [bacterium]
MVDINLIGDDQTQFNDEEDEKDFQDAYGSDSNDFSKRSYIKGSSIDNTDYTKVMRRSGSKTGVIILFIIVIALLASTAYILFKPGKTVDQIQITPTVTEAENFEDALDEAVTEETASDAEPILESSVSPVLRQRIIQSRQGIKTIGQVINTIPSGINFTLISYQDGNVLFELLANNKPDIDRLDASLKQNVYLSNLNVLSTDVRQIKGRQYHQALVRGNVNLERFRESVTGVRSPQTVGSDALRNRLGVICKENNLSIKQFDSGTEKTENQLRVTPITIRVYGLKTGLMNFLQRMQTENMNVSFNKITLIANEAEPSSPYYTLVLNCTLYRVV